MKIEEIRYERPASFTGERQTGVVCGRVCLPTKAPFLSPYKSRFFLADAQINFNFVGMRFIDNHGKAFGKDGREEPETLERV